MPVLLSHEDESVENTVVFYYVSYHRILQNAVVTSVVIATGKAMHKKVRSGRCFAAHLLFVSCAGFGWVVSRVYLGVVHKEDSVVEKVRYILRNTDECRQ